MVNVIPLSRPSIWPRVAVGLAAVAALALAAGAAFAGECPAGQRVADGQGQKPGPTAAVGVVDKVRASTDLAKEPAAIKGRQFRLRQLDIAPGGVVPWHSHNERPAMIYIVSGEVVEYASSCAVPIVHRAGDVAAEKNGTSHWWKNTGGTPAVLISVDLFPGDAQHDEHMM
ncbi:MAG: cupin domain-containing protein [Piscinibacter sp.]|uniref:cupin domain-containing protein n=1 Tax=Piscinibacter sp. TaxID=1903157 RepID=UPI0025859E2E|nr:cupin domain-containing protein [Piscinibacter sp.]MCW5663190.1 cupin domain-containing protein [Piscinibacter sp.]